MRHAVVSVLLVVATAAMATAQETPVAAPGPITLPLDVRGLVHRGVQFGCGQAWNAHDAWSTTTLTISTARRAQLVLDARVVDESGGVAGLLTGTPYHTQTERARHVEWTGRARRDGAAWVIALSGLLETVDVEGAPAGTQVTNRSTLAATLRCVHEARDVFPATPSPTSASPEAPVSRRALVTCSFDAVPHEGPLPRPVAELLTTPFLLDAGRGVTTDASYRGGFAVPAPSLVAREPAPEP